MHKLLCATALIAILAACDVAPDDAKTQAAATGARRAEQIIAHSGQNAEQDNIASRLKLTMNPGQIGFILLMNQAGQPIAYYGVKGKLTSSGKRLSKPWVETYQGATADAPSDEGTYGHSDEYIYFWTADGQYIQWNGAYLYSDKPFRTRVAPLVIALGEKS